MRAALIVLVALTALSWVETSVGAAPRFVRNIDTGETGWFASPALVDLDGDRRLEIRRAVLQHVRLRRPRPAAGQGHGDRGSGVRARRGRRPRRRRGEGDRRRRQRGNRRGLRPRHAGHVARFDVQRRAVSRDARPGRRRPRPRRPDRGGRHHHEYLARRARRSSPSTRPARWFQVRRGTTPRTPSSTASATTATGRTARTSASASSTTTRSSRSSSPSTTTRSTSSTTTGPSVLAWPWYTNRQNDYAGRRLGWGQFIRWLSPKVER